MTARFGQDAIVVEEGLCLQRCSSITLKRRKPFPLGQIALGRRVIPTLSYGDKFYWEILTKSRKGVLPMDQLTQFRY